MSDIKEMLDEQRERAKSSDFSQPAPAEQKRYERIDKDLQHKHSYAEQAAKEHAKEALEELYESEFPIDDPPDSFERYEAELTLRHLRASIVAMFTRTGQLEHHFVVNAADGEVTEVPELTDTEEPDEAAWDEAAWDQLDDEAKQRIDVMATYGNLAEQHIAALTSVEHSEVREYATKTLAELRADNTESKSLTAALRDWWRGEP